MVRLFQFKP